jgi:hypothetical protein
LPVAYGPIAGTTIRPLAGSTYGLGCPEAIGPVNGTGARPDGVTPSVEVSAGGVVGTYGFCPTGWVVTGGWVVIGVAVEPSA